MSYFKSFILWLIFLITVIYCARTAFVLGTYVAKYKKLNHQYKDLVAEQEELQVYLQKLSTKVQGIREKTLDPKLLEDRLKDMMNYKDKNELIITN